MSMIELLRFYLVQINYGNHSVLFINRYKYTYLQEMIGDIVSTRTVFERWMRNFPNEQAWLTYIKFEMRCGKEENARKLYERMIEQIPEQIVILLLSFFIRVIFDMPNGKNAKETKLIVVLFLNVL